MQDRKKNLRSTLEFVSTPATLLSLEVSKAGGKTTHPNAATGRRGQGNLLEPGKGDLLMDAACQR